MTFILVLACSFINTRSSGYQHVIIRLLISAFILVNGIVLNRLNGLIIKCLTCLTNEKERNKRFEESSSKSWGVFRAKAIMYDQGDLIWQELWRTPIHLFKVPWNDHLLNFFSLIHRWRINTNLLALKFSCAIS